MNKLKLGESERDLLVFFARNPEATVRDASDYFAADRGWARTTVLKTVERLIAKGLLVRDEIDGVFRHRSIYTETELQERLIGQLIAGPLGGSLRPFVAYLDGHSKVSKDELDDLRALVKRLEERR